jgi:hypothetical protein
MTIGTNVRSEESQDLHHEDRGEAGRGPAAEQRGRVLRVGPQPLTDVTEPIVTIGPVSRPRR